MVDPTRAICTVLAVLALALTSGRVANAQRDGVSSHHSFALLSFADSQRAERIYHPDSLK